ncbi:hypothetical protein TeGR_g1822 [Tetraparma gracilis]|uniref:C3H1-type domain-containing protein n=1 Tax=Tetraparma gracilis TaxID=2962635 RepID=A0ABQ6MWB0_9STRA|nr:hypothetical protein TeGR_g1822 [Tetraparma gracilis]
MSPAAPKRKFSPKPVPPGYACAQCGSSEHWVFSCPDKQKKKKSKANPAHAPVQGQDPSEADKQRAREMQREMAFVNKRAPSCFCGDRSRLAKVRKSADPASPAVGQFFFFCGKGKHDETKCRFARPAKEETVAKKKMCSFWAKGTCKKGDRCEFAHSEEGREIVKGAKEARKERKEEREKGGEEAKAEEAKAEEVKAEEPKAEEAEEPKAEELKAEEAEEAKAEESSSSSDSSDSEDDNDLDDQNF